MNHKIGTRVTLEPPKDCHVFALPLPILPEHIDENKHVNNVVYVGWLQDAGIAHWSAYADTATQAKWSWVALRHEIDYFRPIAPDAAGIVANTWIGEVQGAYFHRYVRIEDANGKLHAQGISTWCLVDAATMRPRRIPPELLAPFLHAPNATEPNIAE